MRSPKPNSTKAAATDSEFQAQVDAALMEQGFFAPLDLLLAIGRLAYEDYAAWRRGELPVLDAALMGSPEKIRGELESATRYARDVGLIEQPQEFSTWGASHGALHISADPALRRLIGSRHVPAQSAPQRDLFFDNPIVALSTGVVRGITARDRAEAQRLLDRLYAQAPNHEELPHFDRLIEALAHLDRPITAPRSELQFLLEITPCAKRLLGSQWRDLLTPLWRQLAVMPGLERFLPDEPQLHRSFAWSQAQDWNSTADSVLAVPHWHRHAPLCLRLAESGFHRRRRAETLMGWCHLCWLAPELAEQALQAARQPDGALRQLWETFLDGDEALDPALFPAWLLIAEPTLAQHLAEDLPKGESSAERAWHCAHRWARARRTGDTAAEIELRRILRADHAPLFTALKAMAQRSQ